MLHPVGKLPARVYWRRRLVFVGVPLVGIVLIAWAALSGGGDRPNARNTASTTTKSSGSVLSTTSAQPRDSGSIGVSTTTAKPASSSAGAGSPTSGASRSSSAGSAAAGKGFCGKGDLNVVAGTAKKSFAVRSKPGLYMQVTNTSATSCKLDIADKHVEWRVYSGDVRFWGSHDCAVQSGANVVTLTAKQSIRLSISWSGLTSAPKCAGTRIAVQAGTYRLYAYLNGQSSPASTFTIK